MRVNIYAEEISDDIEIIEKTTPEGTFTGLRMYLYLPVTLPDTTGPDGEKIDQVRGKFMHHPGDDDDHWPMLNAPEKTTLGELAEELDYDMDKPVYGRIPEATLRRHATGKMVFGDDEKHPIHEDFKDAMIYGSVFRQGGKRIEPHRIFIDPAGKVETCAIAPIKQEGESLETYDEFGKIDEQVWETTGPKHEISRKALDAAHDVVHKFKGAK